MTTLSSVVINEKDVSHVMSLHENHLQQSCEAVKIYSPKINTENNQIINSMSSINPENYPDISSPESMLLSVAHGNAGSANDSQTVSKC